MNSPRQNSLTDTSNNMATRIAFYTLGCKSNQYDTEIMKKESEKRPGYRVVSFGEDADISVINTCSVTTGADRKSRKYIRRAHRRGETVLVTGCYVTLNSDVIANIDGVDLIFPNSHKYEFRQVLETLEKGYTGIIDDREAINWDLDSETIGRDRNHTRAFVKVQDGCSNNCSFCKVRYLRGPTRSKSPGKVLEEARELGDNGFSEIVLTGVNLAEYGAEGLILPDLLEELTGVKEISRIRLSSINPAGITKELLDVFQFSRKLCPYFHVPLQSGSNEILDSMERNYTREKYLERIEMIKKRLEAPTFGTDVLVGFPGEGEDDFKRTKEIIEKVKFLNLHEFRFTPREVTPAANYDDRIDSTVKKERADEISHLAAETAGKVRRRFEGKRLKMVLEEPSKIIDGWRGYARNYLDLHLPKNSVEERVARGDTVTVELERAGDEFNLAKRPESLALNRSP